MVLTGWLDRQRATVRLKVDGLSEQDGYRSLVATSPRMTVAGVVSHLRATEHGWFTGSFPSISGPRRDDDRGGWLFEHRPLAELVDEYDAECVVSRRIVAALDLGAMQEFTPPEYPPVSLRWIVTHMIEETARHLGHLDILREHLDGTRTY